MLVDGPNHNGNGGLSADRRDLNVLFAEIELFAREPQQHILSQPMNSSDVDRNRG
jgi:hypothetical protein